MVVMDRLARSRAPGFIAHLFANGLVLKGLSHPFTSMFSSQIDIPFAYIHA